MVRSALSLTACVMLVLAAGCQDRSGESAIAAVPPPVATDSADPAPIPEPALPAPANSAPPVTATGADAWLGQWTGPEGTSLLLEKVEGGGYQVTIQSLDGKETFAGDAAGPNIVFERNGKTETLRAGSGKLTGMKWLADKTDCLVIQAGEGFCRD